MSEQPETPNPAILHGCS